MTAYQTGTCSSRETASVTENQIDIEKHERAVRQACYSVKRLGSCGRSFQAYDPKRSSVGLLSFFEATKIFHKCYELPVSGIAEATVIHPNLSNWHVSKQFIYNKCERYNHCWVFDVSEPQTCWTDTLPSLAQCRFVPALQA